MDNKELIERAASLIRRHQTGDGRLHGDVGAVVLSARGNVYGGVCVDTASWGLCAERSAIAAMITAGEYRLQKVVAVWQNEKTGKLHVLPPCGVCREFMRQIDGHNLEAEIVLGLATSRSLRELIPEHKWPAPLPCSSVQ
jgi:cytidine deaminase